jgi:hypothetical protein
MRVLNSGVSHCGCEARSVGFMSESSGSRDLSYLDEWRHARYGDIICMPQRPPLPLQPFLFGT